MFVQSQPKRYLISYSNYLFECANQITEQHESALRGRVVGMPRAATGNINSLCWHSDCADIIIWPKQIDIAQ